MKKLIKIHFSQEYSFQFVVVFVKGRQNMYYTRLCDLR